MNSCPAPHSIPCAANCRFALVRGVVFIVSSSKFNYLAIRSTFFQLQGSYYLNKTMRTDSVEFVPGASARLVRSHLSACARTFLLGELLQIADKLRSEREDMRKEFACFTSKKSRRTPSSGSPSTSVWFNGHPLKADSCEFVLGNAFHPMWCQLPIVADNLL